MNKQRAIVIALVASLAFNGAFCSIWVYHTVYARPKLAEETAQKQEPTEAAQAMPPAFDRLHLTPEQRRQVLAQYAGFREEFGRALREAEASRDEVLVVLSNPQAPPEALQGAERKLAVQQDRIRKMVLDSLAGMSKVLNEEQRREFGQMLRQGPPPQKTRPFMRRPMRPFRPEPQPPGQPKPDKPENPPL